MEYVLLFLLGVSIGSFLNVLIDRIPRNESVMKGRSYCENCKAVLRWYDLIPLLSFILIKGKCRYCNINLSFYYPIVELVTGLLFIITAFLILNNFQFTIFNLQSNPNFQFSFFLQLVFILYVVSSLIVIFFTDLKYGIIPNRVLYPMIFITFLLRLTSSKSASEEPWLPLSLQPVTSEVLITHLLSAAGSFLFFLLIFLITRGKGMGFGDVKLAFFMGLLLGFPKIISAFYIAFLTGAIVSIILVLGGRKKFKGDTVPFGPFLVLGTLVSFFVGEKILHIFLGGVF